MFKSFFLNEFLFQSILSLFFRIVAASSGFFFSAVIAKNLGADQSGYFFLVFSIINICAVFCCLGLDQSILFFTSKAVADQDWFLVRDFLIKSLMIVCVLTASVSFSLYYFSDTLAFHIFKKPALSGVLENMSFAVVGLALINLVVMSLQGLRKITSSIFFLNIFSNVILILIITYFPTLGVEFIGSLYAITQAGVFIFSLIYWWLVRPCWPEKRRQAFRWKSVTRHSSSLLLIVLIAQLIQWSSLLICGIWVESSDLARLAMAQRTAMLTSFVLLAINLVVAPRFASMYSLGDFLGIRKLAISSVRLMIFFTLPIVLIILLFPHILMGFFGDEFISGTHLLQILVFGQIINVITGPVNNLLIMTGNESKMKKTMLISGSVVVLLNFILVPIYGVIGGAFATALAVCTQNIIAAWYVNRKLSINIFTPWRA